MRALEPAASGFAVNPHDGVRSYYEVFGPPDAARTIMFLPTWSLVQSRVWKMQVPYFAHQGFRVVTFDGRGNGQSDRPASGYTTDDFVRDASTVLDTLAIERAALVGSNPYRKPTLQTILPMPNKGDITLTWARFPAPSGKRLPPLGVLPTICTVGQKDAGQLISALAAGELQQVPTGKRNAVRPDDIAGMDALRRTCPARHDTDPAVCMSFMDRMTAMRGASANVGKVVGRLRGQVSRSEQNINVNRKGERGRG